MTNLFDLTGRTAIVTGSAQGMGRAMALALAEAGADVVTVMRPASRRPRTPFATSAARRCRSPAT
jgi:NAD(P)-dependent dehydrogenase (short-subunit alcohol dehydrogenase family)